MSETEPSTFLSHLVELRSRLIRSVVAIVVVFILLAGFSAEIYQLVATPLMELLPRQSAMIATEVAAPFLTPFKLTFFVAIYLAMPYVLLQCWLFVSPGLYEQEKHLALPLFVTSVILFYAGTLFALLVVSPLLYAFFNATAPEGVLVMPDISRFLDFIIKLAFGFGLAFEVPVITFLAVKTGLVGIATLREKRPYIIIAAFVFGMLLTPPDVVSQLLLAIPVLLLFEISLFLSARIIPQKSGERHSESG